ncbi:hypothetical protein [Agrilutibacter solisilvae]|uniref:Uncharacterized protein n=1 Tax=Agrilutibacter solisilvae TaxID=2763317 RepID=A0A975ARA2_9GAMM|nr:hypothetical protein [Lysobacter solisilvae]QSX77452.1 hypothetical protein I8J32_011875 [Lysobacter solisilvae]
MKLEFRIPISPKPAFYAQVRLIAQSLASLGSAYAQARIQVSVGDRASLAEVHAHNAWAQAFPVDWYVVPDELHARMTAPEWASGHGRYACPSDADIVVLCDADTCPVAPFDDLLTLLHGAPPAVAGLQAHSPPFANNEETWLGLLRAIDRPGLPLDRRYSIDVDGRQLASPAYFNYGFVAFNAAAFTAVSARIDECLDLACRMLPRNRFAAQVALTLAMAETGVDVVELGHEYNCANDDRLLAHAWVQPEDVRVIHYLRGDDLARHEFLCNRALFDAFVGAPRQNAINERLRIHLLTLPDACGAEALA